MKFSFKKYLPHFAAVAVFVVLTLVYFRPLMSGKVLVQGDISRARAMAKEVVDFRNTEKAEALWTNSMFGGMPAYQISVIYPGNWLSKIDQAFKILVPHPAGFIFLCFLGFFILLLCLDIDPWLAIVGSIGYGLSSYFLIALEAGHNSKINAIGYLPAMIGGIILIFKGRYWLGAAVTVLFMAMELNANHVQITYYGFMIVGALLVTYFYYAYKEKKLRDYFKAFAFLAAAGIIAVLPNCGNLLGTYEYGKYTTRGKTELTINSALRSNAGNVTTGLDKGYATQYSYGIGETFTFLIPDFKGGGNGAIGNSAPDALKKVNSNYREQVARSDPYFGDQPGVGGPVYLGAIIVFLCILSLFIVKHKIKWALVFAIILSITLSWGSNFMGLTSFFMDHVPGYNKFRAVSMILVICEMCFPLLAVMALSELLKAKSLTDKIKLSLFKKEMELKRILLIVFILVGGFCLAGWLVPDLVNTFHGQNEEAELVQRFVSAGYPANEAKAGVAELLPQIEIARKAMFTSDSLRSFIFILLSAVFIYLFLTKKLKKELFFAAIGIFILIDLWTLDTRYLNDKSFVTKSQYESQFDKTPTDEEILKDTTLDYRVLNLSVQWYQDAMTSYWHKSVGGYHGAKLKKYAEMIEFHFDKEVNTFYDGINEAIGKDSLLNALLAKLNVINMMNTKYLILPAGKDGESTFPLKNPQANGNAWFVKKLKTVTSADSEIVGLYRIDTKTEAVIRDNFKKEANAVDSYPASGSIRMLSYKPNYLVYESNTTANEFAVFSEIYYPKGWNAYVDGVLTPHVGVNYILRGMPIPQGKHKIEFKFEPTVYSTSNNLAMAGSAIWLISIGLCLFIEFKKRGA